MVIQSLKSKRMPVGFALFATVVGLMLPYQSLADEYRKGACGSFTVAAIPDSQNYLDFRHQKSEGFPVDAHEMFFEQMQYVADNARSNGGDIVFATHLGDIWQNRVQRMDPGHELRGFRAAPESVTGGLPEVFPEGVRNHEIPNAVKGFEIISGKLPFSVVPGNHDYDAIWVDANNPPHPDRDGDIGKGIRHVGGLKGFLSAFSDQSEFFRGQAWYIASNDGGADSAQIFTAGQCRFLHIGLQFDAPASSLAWARRVILQNPGLPTIVSTHKFTDRDGKRAVGGPLDMSIIDRHDNNPQMVWDDFISRHDQIFLVLSGHIGGQGYGIDYNDMGNEVHQMLADYQPRWRAAKVADPEGKYPGNPLTGDGWLRLLSFELDGERPRISVRTYSTHFRKFSSEMPEYASWYKAGERQAGLSEQEFLARDEFVVELRDFHKRFSRAGK
ncbi:hypothetical protein [Luteimonas sp. e5]